MEYEIIQNLKDICKELEKITEILVDMQKINHKVLDFYFDEEKGICCREKDE